MWMRTYAVHAPALSLAEAAMLPALPAQRGGAPRNLLMPTDHLHFRHGDVDSGGRTVDNFSQHRGTMAGRALLAYVQNAPARRQRR